MSLTINLTLNTVNFADYVVACRQNKAANKQFRILNPSVEDARYKENRCPTTTTGIVNTATLCDRTADCR
jgi:hypothetical protein